MDMGATRPRPLLNIVRLPEGMVEKWLAKAGVDLFEDMPADAIAKCIAYVQNRLQSGMWSAEPNAAHDALVALERARRLHALVTQNVDGLHLAAGQSAEIVVEIHGNVREVKCMTCPWRGPMEETLDRVRAGEADPACTECGGILKSATISFGENLVAEDLERSQREAAQADVFLALGTSLVVYPAAALPEVALRSGAQLVVCNAEETPFDPYADAVFREQLGELVPALAELV